MWKYLTDEKYNEFLLSLNLVNTTDIKSVNKILYNISNNIDLNYEEKVIEKKNGKLRFLYEPSKELKSIQKRILKNVLEERKLSKYVTSYRKGYSLKDNAKSHVNKDIILKLDIKNFFDNITFNKVYNICFNEDLYPKKLGILLTNLCCYNNKLPQGAPTSGYISNLILRSFDEKVGKYSYDNNISYTRYSDDLTFSGNFNVDEIIKFISYLLKEEGFILNKKKIKVIRKSQRQIVTGIVVNKKLSINRKYKKEIGKEMYYINKYGTHSHLSKLKILNKDKYLSRLLGKINYVIQIEGEIEEFQNYKSIVTHMKEDK